MSSSARLTPTYEYIHPCEWKSLHAFLFALVPIPISFADTHILAHPRCHGSLQRETIGNNILLLLLKISF